MAAYQKILWLLCAQSAQWIQAHEQFPGQPLNAMSFQSRSPYSYPATAAAPNLLRPQQVQQFVQQPQQQLEPLRLQQQSLQQRKEAENARLWREAEEEERQEEEQEQEAAAQQKKQQQLMQLRKQEQAHPAPPAESFGLWTKFQGAMQSVSLQALYNVVLFAIASGAIAFSFKGQMASMLNQTKEASKKVLSCTKPEPHVEEAPLIAADQKLPLASKAQEDEIVTSKSVSSTTAKSVAHVPRPPAERVAQSSNESTPIYLCEAKIHKYDGIDALQKALKTHSEHVAQGSNNCIVIAGNPGKDAPTCAQQ